MFRNRPFQPSCAGGKTAPFYLEARRETSMPAAWRFVGRRHALCAAQVQTLRPRKPAGSWLPSLPGRRTIHHEAARIWNLPGRVKGGFLRTRFPFFAHPSSRSGPETPARQVAPVHVGGHLTPQSETPG
jgi:hypothetical protein